jgi:HEPN domain-containing protein
MNRADLQRLSNVRIREAKILFAEGEYSGAYYLAGYALECALKACFAKKVKKYDFPNKNMRNIFTHAPTELIVWAGLKDELLAARQTNSKFAAGWDVVCRWTEESRYSSILTKSDAEEILDALVRRKDGVLPWIKRYW